MKATGIVRRIDDLGRVVIPKEIRRTMRIREGDPLEIFTDREGEVIFKKYSPIGELASFAVEYAETMHKTCDMSVLICDRDGIIAVSGLSKKEYADKTVSDEISRIMESRAVYSRENGTKKIYPLGEEGSHYVVCAMPIISGGDIMGCVLAMAEDSSETYPDATTVKLVKTAAGFLGRQLEN